MNQLSFREIYNNCEWFEPRSHIPCLSVILRVKVVLRNTFVVVVVVD